MAEILSALLSLTTLVFAVSSMLSVGLGYTLSDVVGPLRNVPAVVRALLANFVLVPLLAYIVVRFLNLEPPQAIGLMLIGMGAGAPFLIQLTAAAGGEVRLSATLLVLLMPVTIFYMPIVVPRVVPGVTVGAGAIAMPLVLSMLVPLMVGLFAKGRGWSWADRLQPIMARVAQVSIVALIALIFLANLPGILDMTLRAVLAALLVVGGAFGIGYVLGGSNPDVRDVLGLGTGQRNIAAATVAAAQGFENPDALVMVVVSSLVGLALLFPIATQLREREAKRAGAYPAMQEEPA